MALTFRCFVMGICLAATSSTVLGDLVVLSPFDGESRTSISGFSGIATDKDTVFTVSASTGTEVRTVLEFDTSGIAPGSIVTSAILSLTADTSVGTSTEIELHHYIGNGTIDVADFSAVHGSPLTHNTATSLVAPTLNAIDVTSMFVLDDYSGFRVSQNTDPGTFNFIGLLGGGNAPTLTVVFVPVPEPSSMSLVALLMLTGLNRRRRRPTL